MAASDAQAFPAYGRPFRLYFAFLSGGNLVQGWGTASTLVSIDGASATAGPTAYEIPSSTGVGYVDLDAATMSGRAVTVVATSGTNKAAATIYTVDLRDNPGRASRMEEFFTQMWRRFFNRRVATSTSVTVFRDSPNSSQTLLSGQISSSATGAEGGEMQ
jgi:hypothetical protein